MIPQFEPFIGQEEKDALCKCIDDNWITSGPRVAEFEEKIANLCNVKHAVTISNGTLAIFVALKAAGIDDGKVIVPDFTFFATASAVIMTGATPIFADVDPISLCITPETIDAVMTKDVKAVMPVGMYGQCDRWDEIKTYCDDHKILMIEDSAQDIGVFYKNKAVGTFGQAGTYSFYGDKVLSTGEGGMIVTDDDTIYDNCLHLKYQGNRTMGMGYRHERIGWNFRMSDLNASVGLAQFAKLNQIIQRKKDNELKFRKSLVAVEKVRFMQINKDCDNVPFRTIIFVPDAYSLQKYLISKEIGSRTLFYPLHLLDPFLASYGKLSMPGAERAYLEGISLPSSVKISDDDIEYICDKIKDFYK